LKERKKINDKNWWDIRETKKIVMTMGVNVKLCNDKKQCEDGKVTSKKDDHQSVGDMSMKLLSYAYLNT